MESIGEGSSGRENYRDTAILSLTAATLVGLILLFVSSLGLLFLLGRIVESPDPDDMVLLGLILGLAAFPLAGWIAFGFRKFVLACGFSLYPLAAAALLIVNAAA